jgi:hypothetical protein
MNNKIYYAAVALATIPNSVFAQQAEFNFFRIFAHD